jgi:xylulose-5-phosphate/fructose-6-phosphate phosphoketolase
VHGYNEEGTTTTPFDMVVLNGLYRFHLAMDVVGRVAKLSARAPHIRQAFRDKLLEHEAYIRIHGEDMPEIKSWGWPYKSAARAGD